MRSLKSLYSNVRHYSRLFGSSGDRLLAVQRLRATYPEVVVAAEKSYSALAKTLVWSYGEIRKSLTSGKFRGNPPRQSLEHLERLFLSLRDNWDDAQYRASRLRKRGKDQSALVAQQAADILASELERVAKIVVAQADRLGRWTVEWERGLGIRQWIR